MIYLGLSPKEKAEVIEKASTKKAYLLSPKRFQIPGWSEELSNPETQGAGTHRLFIDWPHVVFYRWYYRLLQEVDGDTTIILNEPLRTQNRHNLAYNCIRNYLNQVGRVLVFSTLPIIDTMDDFMILVDFETQSKWRRQPFDRSMLSEVSIEGMPLQPAFQRVDVPVDDKIRAKYASTKERLLSEVQADGDKDPHQIPRNLHLVSGPAKVPFVSGPCLGRNDRFHLEGMETYRAVKDEGERIIFEFPHNFIDYADALAITRAPHARALVADTKADDWYYSRFTEWAGRVRDASTTIHG